MIQFVIQLTFVRIKHQHRSNSTTATMNRFRGRKKAKEELVTAPPRPSVESESSGPFKMFGKRKTAEEEPKIELDLTTALPSSDDFRTSLLMTGLSARFSMLREQDDPNTKVGKASDDSVLYPKRQSRMMDFGYGGGLTDIAEVESIRGGPGFARVHSFVSTDDAASTSGSIMTRAKPSDGNNLFGGRQKIYKIPAGGLSKNGNLPGRALYEDDVAQSAFQRWRQSEKDRRSLDEDIKDDSLESDVTRPGSPSHPEYNRRRETSSTTSSGPSAARNSTAATSITSSQPSYSVKDWLPATTPGATSPAPGVERSVTRTRRLYEQSLNQDLQDQQSSALSRIDTLSKQRNFGTRTPDLTPVLPSPTSATFSDRFANNRSILSKASAPNLRSFTPSTNTSQMSPVEPNNKFSTFEQSTSFGAAPPLSPPISETEEHAVLAIGPNDNGKATSLGVFSKPAGQYDDSRYAQRQMQLQKGRETPTDRFRTNSNASEPTSRSRSSSAHRTSSDQRDSTSLKTKPTVTGNAQASTFFDDDDDDDQSVDEEPARLSRPPQVTLKRPDDDEHPAFRKSALPTPLTLSFRATDGPSPISERFDISNTNSKNASPEDSPTLGPTTGLSGMVRHHLRNDSNSSSVYESLPNDSDLALRFPPEREEQGSSGQLETNSNTWNPSVGDWASLDDRPRSMNSNKNELDPQDAELRQSSSTRNSRSDVEEEEKQENDEFARHLADGARRVRERLTSYVESEPSVPTPPPVPTGELPQPPRANALGILKSKSSRGSLIDRTRGDKEGLGQSKAKKLLGLGSSTMAVSPSAKQTSFEFNEEARKSDRPSSGEQPSDDDQTEGEKDNVHAGLKAFRQARRELQRMKEIETQQRYQGPPKGTPYEQTSAAAPVPPTSPRAASQERRPPISFNYRMPSDESRNGPRSRSGSRAPSERDRSGSEASSGGRSGSRPPPRLRNGSIPYDEHHGPMGLPHGPNGMPRQGPMMRAPGVPGQDMKRSPHMPPQPYQSGNISPNRFKRSESAQNLSAQPYGNYDQGQPHPVSPINGAPSPYGAPSPRPHAGNLDPHHPANRLMRTRDFSEPAFASPPSQPAMGSRSRSGSLIQAAASTPNLHGNLSAPPVPPINPRRKNNILGGFMRRSEDEMSMSSPHLPMSSARNDNGHPSRSPSEDDNGRSHQSLRKATSEAHGLNVRARSMRNSPPQPLTRPPLPPTMSGSGLPGGMI